jgi:hypothetical protein
VTKGLFIFYFISLAIMLVLSLITFSLFGRVPLGLVFKFTANDYYEKI